MEMAKSTSSMEYLIQFLHTFCVYFVEGDLLRIFQQEKQNISLLDRMSLSLTVILYFSAKNS